MAVSRGLEGGGTGAETLPAALAAVPVSNGGISEVFYCGNLSAKRLLLLPGFEEGSENVSFWWFLFVGFSRPGLSE